MIEKFVPAEARIEGDALVVSSPHVPAPKAVRHAWHRYPEGGNLFNRLHHGARNTAPSSALVTWLA